MAKTAKELAQLIVDANREVRNDDQLRSRFALIHEHALGILNEEKLKSGRGVGDCTCYLDCRQDSHSGDWHQHEDDPCPIHPDAPIVG